MPTKEFMTKTGKVVIVIDDKAVAPGVAKIKKQIKSIGNDSTIQAVGKNISAAWQTASGAIENSLHAVANTIGAVGQRMVSVGGQMVAVGAKIAAAGAAMSAPFVASSKIFNDWGNEVADAADKTQLGAETISSLMSAAKQAGAGTGDLTSALIELRTNSTGAQAAAGKLGLKWSDVAALPLDERFKVFADRIAAIRDPIERASLASQVFGGSGRALLPLLEKGAAGISHYQKMAQQLGLTLSAEDAKAAKTFGDAMKQAAGVASLFWDAVKKVGFTIGQILAPGIEAAAAEVNGWTIAAAGYVKKAVEMIQENKGLIIAAFNVAKGVAAAGAAIAAIGTVVSAAGVGLMGISAAMVTLLPVALGAFAAFRLGRLAFTALGAAGVDVSAGLSVAKTSAIEYAQQLMATFQEIAARVGVSVQGISDALIAGDLTLAGQIAMATLEGEFNRGLIVIKDAWQSVWGSVAPVAVDAVAVVVVAASNAAAELESIWAGLAVSLQKAFATAVEWIAKSFEWLGDLAEKVLHPIDATVSYISGVEVKNNRDADKVVNDYAAQQRTAANDAESGLTARRAAIASNAEGRAAALRSSVQATGASIVAGGSTNVGGNIEAASDAQDRIAKLVAEAAAARAAFDANRQAPGGPAAAQAAAGAAGEAAKAGGSVTTFDAGAAARGFGNSPAERTEQNTRVAAERLEQIVKVMRENNGLALTA